MDTFMDKLAQKFTAQEMIKANAAAEAAELQRVRSQVKQYNDCLQEMRQVNDGTKAALAQIEETLAAGLEQLQNAQIPTEGLNELVECSLNRIRELQLNTEEIQADIKGQIEKQGSEITDFVHKENVKVYRNVQAVVVEELRKQNEELEEKFAVITKKQKATFGIALTSMIFGILAVVVLVFQLLMQFGILVF